MEGDGSRGARWDDAVDATTCPFILEEYRRCYMFDGDLVLNMRSSGPRPCPPPRVSGCRKESRAKGSLRSS